MVEEAIEQMKRFKLGGAVDDSTSHVVCGDSRRTLNVMHGIARGLKIVSLKWVRAFIWSIIEHIWFWNIYPLLMIYFLLLVN
jgi:hypothetical protein